MALPISPTRPLERPLFVWGLVFLLLGSTTINQIDRVSISVLGPLLREEFHLSASKYAAILNAFMVSYMFMYAAGGWLVDRLGVRRGLSACITWWSIASSLQGLARGPLSMSCYRALIGIGEGGNWPAFAKAISLWVPKKMQSLALGIANSGSSVGTIIAYPLLASLTVNWGWRFAFIATGSLGFAWLVAWLWATKELSEPKTPPRERIPWIQLLRHRQTWSVFVGRFLADPIWYFFVFWLPDFLKYERGLDLAATAKIGWIPYVMADIGNFTGGGVSSWLLHRGWSLNRVRKTVMILAAVICPCMIAAVYTKSLFWTMFFISLSVFVFICWAVTLHALPGDFFPPDYVGSVFGFGGMGSSLGTVVFTRIVGLMLDHFHSYKPVFLAAGCLLPVACTLTLLLMGTVSPLEIRKS